MSRPFAHLGDGSKSMRCILDDHDVGKFLFEFLDVFAGDAIIMGEDDGFCPAVDGFLSSSGSIFRFSSSTSMYTAFNPAYLMALVTTTQVYPATITSSFLSLPAISREYKPILASQKKY